MTVLIRSKEDNTENFKKFYDVVNGETIGSFSKETFAGPFFSQFKKDFKVRAKKTVDISGKILTFLGSF